LSYGTSSQRSVQPGQRAGNAAYQSRKRNITVDPITRLEGHGKIDIFLNDQGDVERAYMQVPELRGFEVFSLGRPAEDMPQITSRICGVCPPRITWRRPNASTTSKTPPTSAGRKIRELVYNNFMLEDHALHVFVLGGPDFIVGPEAPPELRNIVGVIQKVGLEAGKKVIARAGACANSRLFRRQSGAPGAGPAGRRGQGAETRGPAEVQGTLAGTRSSSPSGL
jgi:hypothetical protein